LPFALPFALRVDFNWAAARASELDVLCAATVDPIGELFKGLNVPVRCPGYECLGRQLEICFSALGFYLMTDRGRHFR
jgi:hypothetical protein